MNSVFYAETYHPIQAGSIDGTDVLPHDNAVYRALLSSSAGLYDPFGDPRVTGDPYCSLFVARLSHLTSEVTLRKAMEKYGRVKDLRLVRHIVTGASRGYAFVEFETERDMRRAYEEAHHSVIDDSEIMVDYNRQQLMPGWIPRRLGGGLGGKKESGQLRFGGRERPFRAPLRPIPHEELKRLGIPPPPEGKYKSRFQVPSPPRRNRSSIEERDMHPDRTHAKHSSKRYSAERENSSRRSMDRKRHSHRLSSREAEDYSQEEDGHKERICHSKSRHSDDKWHSARSSIDVEDECERDQEKDDHKERIRHYKSRLSDDKGYSARSSVDVEDECEREQEEEHSHNGTNKDRDADESRRRKKDKDKRTHRSSRDGDEHSQRRSKDVESRSRKRSRDDKTRSSKRTSDDKESSNKHHHRHSSTRHSHHKRHRADSTSP